jgi:hypothetical protein
MRTTPLLLAAALSLAACAAPATRAVGDSADTPASASAAPVKVKAMPLTAADVKLAVKVTKKDCFGTAGCNVTYEIKVTTDKTRIQSGDRYEVTYTVKGLQDDQIGTLTLKDDGTYEQDSYQFGQTKTAAAKLTAVVTDVTKEL